MAARVDIRAMLVREGDIALAFAADCGAGTAVLDPHGDAQDLRTMRWGEKCRLARHADAAPAFLEAQFVAICCEGSVSDPTRRAALGALALWLHGSAVPALALDAQLLGEVTLRLCAKLGIGPAALAELAVPEVEALWQSLTTDTAPAAGASDFVADGMTRIVIEPDPPGVPDAPDFEPVAPALAMPADDADVPGMARRPSASAEPEPFAPAAPRPEPEPFAPAAPRTEPESATTDVAASAQQEPAAATPLAREPTAGVRPVSLSARGAGARRAARAPTPRFRIASPVTLPTSAPATAEAPPLQAAPPTQGAHSHSPTTGHGRATHPEPGASVAPVRPKPAAAAMSIMPEASRSTESRPKQVPIRAWIAPAEEDRPSAGPGAPLVDDRLGALIDFVTRATAAPDAAPDPDAMFDSFNERLADAVADLSLAGIG